MGYLQGFLAFAPQISVITRLKITVRRYEKLEFRQAVGDTASANAIILWEYVRAKRRETAILVESGAIPMHLR